jgi:hypothetical protein
VLLPVKMIMAEASLDEKSSLDEEFRGLIESNPYAPKTTEAIENWNMRAQNYLKKCGNIGLTSIEKAQLSKSEKSAVAGLRRAQNCIKEIGRLLPERHNKCCGLESEIEEVLEQIDLFCEAHLRRGN